MDIDPTKLIDSAGFQEAVGSDEELNRLFHEQAVEMPLKDAELLVAVGGGILVAGSQLPAPSAVTISLLEIIDSPFLARDKSTEDIGVVDAVAAMFILRERRSAVPYLLAVKMNQLILERLQNSADKNSAEVRKAIAFYQDKDKSLMEIFRSVALECCLDVAVFDEYTVVRELQMFLDMTGGFDMLPQLTLPETKKRNRNFDMDWLTHIVAMVSEVSNASVEDIMWKMPMAETSYLVMQAMRKAGVKGIGIKTKSSQAMKRLKQLMLVYLNKQ